MLHKVKNFHHFSGILLKTAKKHIKGSDFDLPRFESCIKFESWIIFLMAAALFACWMKVLVNYSIHSGSMSIYLYCLVISSESQLL